jgi:hypothetical protein
LYTATDRFFFADSCSMTYSSKVFFMSEGIDKDVL